MKQAAHAQRLQSPCSSRKFNPLLHVLPHPLSAPFPVFTVNKGHYSQQNLKEIKNLKIQRLWCLKLNRKTNIKKKFWQYCIWFICIEANKQHSSGWNSTGRHLQLMIRAVKVTLCFVNSSEQRLTPQKYDELWRCLFQNRELWWEQAQRLVELQILDYAAHNGGFCWSDAISFGHKAGNSIPSIENSLSGYFSLFLVRWHVIFKENAVTLHKTKKCPFWRMN